MNSNFNFKIFADGEKKTSQLSLICDAAMDQKKFNLASELNDNVDKFNFRK